jgi:uncharacterized protein YkwD
MHVAPIGSRLSSVAAPFAAACAALSLWAPAAASQPVCSSASAAPAKSETKRLEQATLCLLNAQRRRRGLGPLRISPRLARSAGLHAADMARRNYFSHVSLVGESFVDRIRETGYLRGVRRWALGENIGWGAGSRSTPRAVVDAWMHSPGHRAIILSTAYRDVGIGLAAGAPVRRHSSRAATYVTDFGARG